MAPTIDDSLPARISPECPQDIRNILHHAWAHDVSKLKNLLHVREKACVQDPQTGETPLHAAIRSCAPASAPAPAPVDPDSTHLQDGETGCVEEAKETLQELFVSGAIWNDVDDNNETPGCVARRLGLESLYKMCVDAGVRAELLFALMDGYEELSSGSDAEDEAAEEDVDAGQSHVQVAADADADADANAMGTMDTIEDQHHSAEPARFVSPDNINNNNNNNNKAAVTSDRYLQSSLTYDSTKLVDSDSNGVMMSWETNIMRQSVAALLPGFPPGKRILNIGFGMGIIDGMFSETNPSRHHIIEAHPSVLEHVSGPESKFGPSWENTGPEEGAFKIWAGKWQEIVPKLLAKGELYDAIYFDTFGEDYAQLKMFFMEYIPGLMDQDGRFSFFNGLGADRQVCYDVYTKVVEMHAADAGLDLEWQESAVDMTALAEDAKGEWEGVRRRYWTLHKYKLPICTFMG